MSTVLTVILAILILLAFFAIAGALLYLLGAGFLLSIFRTCRKS